MAHELAIARAVGGAEGCGANKMKRECERESAMLTEVMPIIFKITSEFERTKGQPDPTDELANDELADQCLAWVMRECNDRHGTKLWDASEAIQQTLTSGFDQWVLLFRESGVRPRSTRTNCHGCLPRGYARPCTSGRTAGTEDTGAND